MAMQKKGAAIWISSQQLQNGPRVFEFMFLKMANRNSEPC